MGRALILNNKERNPALLTQPNIVTSKITNTKKNINKKKRTNELC